MDFLVLFAVFVGQKFNINENVSIADHEAESTFWIALN